jgi:predicted transcriptional regulator
MATYQELVKQRTARKELARQLKQDGLTYQQIASQLGICRQKVQQIVKPSDKEHRLIFDIANNTCSICHNKFEKLHLHHTNYVPPEIIVVCTSCHMKLHKGNHRNRSTQ